MSVNDTIKNLQVKCASISNSAKVGFDNLFSTIKNATEKYYSAIVDSINHVNDGSLVTSFINNGKLFTINGSQVSNLIEGITTEDDSIAAYATDLATETTESTTVTYNQLEEAIAQKLGCGQLFSIFGDVIRNQWDSKNFKANDILAEVSRQCEQNGIPTEINSYNGELFSLLSNTVSSATSYDDAMYKLVNLINDGSISDLNDIETSPVLKYSHAHPFLTYIPEWTIDWSDLWTTYTNAWVWYFKFTAAFYETAWRLVKLGYNKLRAAYLNGLYPIDISVDVSCDDCGISNGFNKIVNLGSSQTIDEYFATFVSNVQARLADNTSAKLRIDTPFGKFFISYDGTIYMKPYVSNNDLIDHINNQINTDPSVKGFCSDILDYLYANYQNGKLGLQYLYNNASYEVGGSAVNKDTEKKLLTSFCESGTLMCEWVIWLFGWNPNIQPLSWFNDWRSYTRSHFNYYIPSGSNNPTNGDWYDSTTITIDFSDTQDSNVEMGWAQFYNLITNLIQDDTCCFINTSDIKNGVTIIDDDTWQATINRILIITAIVVTTILVFKGVKAAKNKAITKIANLNALMYDPTATASQIKSARRQAKFWNALSLGTASNIMNFEAATPLSISTLAYLIKGNINL